MRTRIALALITLGLIVAAPAIVLGASGTGTVLGPNKAVVSWTNTAVTTNSKDWKAVPHLADEQCGGCLSPVALAVSADMVNGAAKVRLVNQHGDVARPGPVRFTSKASNSFTFVASFEETVGGDDFAVQWKRAGHRKAKAAAFSAQLLGND